MYDSVQSSMDIQVRHLGRKIKKPTIFDDDIFECLYNFAVD